MFEKDRKRVSNPLAYVGSFPRRGDDLSDPRDDISSLSFPLLLLTKSKLEANKNNNTKNNASSRPFRVRKNNRSFFLQSRKRKERDGDDAIDYSAKKENY